MYILFCHKNQKNESQKGVKDLTFEDSLGYCLARQEFIVEAWVSLYIFP